MNNVPINLVEFERLKGDHLIKAKFAIFLILILSLLSCDENELRYYFVDGAKGSSTGSGGSAIGVFTSVVADQEAKMDYTSDNFAFTIDDGITGCGSIVASSSDQAVVPDANITIGGVAPNCTVSVLSDTNAVGSATITLSFTLGPDTDTNTFDVDVIGPLTGMHLFNFVESCTGPGNVQSSYSKIVITSTNSLTADTFRVSFASGPNCTNKIGTPTNDGLIIASTQTDIRFFDDAILDGNEAAGTFIVTNFGGGIHFVNWTNPGNTKTCQLFMNPYVSDAATFATYGGVGGFFRDPEGSGDTYQCIVPTLLDI